MLLNVILVKRIAAVRTEFRRVGRILWFPSAFVTAIMRLCSGLGRSAVGTESACVHGTAGAGPAGIRSRSLWLFGTAFRAEIAGN